MKQKTKNMMLVSGFLLMVAIAYKYAISNTLELKKEYRALKKEASVFDRLPGQLSVLKQKERYFDSLLTSYQLGKSSIQNSLLNSINTFADANQLKVVDFIEPHSIGQGDLTVNTYQFTVEGNYNAILSLVYRLERQTKFGEVVNLNFKKEKNYKTGEYFLRARVILKSFG